MPHADDQPCTADPASGHSSADPAATTDTDGSFAGTKAVTAANAFALFQTIVMALVALGWGRLLAVPTGTTKIEGPVTECVLHGEHS